MVLLIFLLEDLMVAEVEDLLSFEEEAVCLKEGEEDYPVMEEGVVAFQLYLEVYY